MSKDIIISVIIPCFNSSKTIIRCLDSVVSQTYSPLEVLVIDDCSKDDTLQVIEAYIQKTEIDFSINIIGLEKNGGPGVARNVGWDNAKGDYIAFLDSDDAWDKDNLLIKSRVLTENPEVCLLANHKREVSGFNAKEADFNYAANVKYISKRDALYRNPFVTSAVLLKKDLPYRFPFKKYSEDYKLWLDIVFGDIGKCAVLESDLTIAFKPAYGASGLSSNLWLMEKGELSNFLELFRNRKINFFEFLFSSTLSYAKYIRRIIKNKVSK